MKNFLKVSLLALTLVFTSTASAQLLPVSIGVKGGLNMSNISTDGYDGKKGFNAGLTVDVNLPANFGIFSGLEVNTKGAQINDTDHKINAMYLQLPVHVGYRLKLLPGLRAQFGFGPYFAQGIGGKTKFGDDKYDTFGDEMHQLKKTDWGLGVHVGVVVLGRIQVRAGYDFGLKNLARSYEEEGIKVEPKLKNRNVYVSAGLIIL